MTGEIESYLELCAKRRFFAAQSFTRLGCCQESLPKHVGIGEIDPQQTIEEMRVCPTVGMGRVEDVLQELSIINDSLFRIGQAHESQWRRYTNAS